MTHSQNGTFCLSGSVGFLIKYISEQYIVLIWILSTEMLVNGGCCCFFFFFFFFFFVVVVTKSLTYFQIKSIIDGLPIK